ncbi:CoA transferase [Streptomyces pseudovenezuelae]|uniref:Crotonobetainyl-CoA:carnitine CoA-transferase CaiB-like acyl-CoA transferase n=1 Tax=Streptomyces pseudovenezuelae TaxID=67350 RepID=A0ABT6LI98_9ACTN|nr:CoA transferase [Streptomyces pseudovenezuelae]MDH6216032.1 crotonobetainyl-CoA:carnitine CoA-transferase CaiB-like acyl-CoA transferase [Streptomyces pseudovenezuelae]
MTGLTFAWSALGGDPALLPRVSTVVREGALQGRLPVQKLAPACVGACALAAAELAARRTGTTNVPEVRMDDGAVATAFVSERHLLVDGRAPETFAPLSRFWRTSDGWVRTHANYPHHRARLLDALGVPEDVDAVAAALAERSSVEVEEAVYAAGGLAVALRTTKEWAAHEQAIAVATRPLVERERLDTAHARVLAPITRTPSLPVSGTPLLPAAGLRVLDLTRVIAGPVATRTLALLGADVLRVDAPQLPELPDQHADTGFGKRSARLDLAADRRAFEELLAAADVVVTGYRPGALDRFGLSPEALAERRPGVVVAQLSAWGAYGPWRGRRGFDSLVQVATGIAALEGSVERPGALPAQALDHGTGYLLAAAVLRALTEQSYEGGSRCVRLSLARTAEWLVNGVEAGDAEDAGDAGGVLPYSGPEAWLAETDSALGRLRYARSPVSFAGGPVDWARPPVPWGTDPARWV